MGLTIYYKLSVEKNLPVAVIHELVECAARYARKIGCVETGKVEKVNADTPFTSLFVRAGREEDCCFGLIPAKRARGARGQTRQGGQGVKPCICVKLK